MRDSPAEFESITFQVSRKPGDWTPRVVSRLWKWGPANNMQENVDFRFSTAREWILLTTQISLPTDVSTLMPPDE